MTTTVTISEPTDNQISLYELIKNPEYFTVYLNSFNPTSVVGEPASSDNDPLARFYHKMGYPTVTVADTVVVLDDFLNFIELSSWSIRLIELVDNLNTKTISAAKARKLLKQALAETMVAPDEAPLPA